MTGRNTGVRAAETRTNRAKMLVAARELFTTRGYTTTTMKAIDALADRSMRSAMLAPTMPTATVVVPLLQKGADIAASEETRLTGRDRKHVIYQARSRTWTFIRH